MKRALRWLALIVAAIYGSAFVLNMSAYSKEDVPAAIFTGVIFALAVVAYLYLSRSLRRIPK